jgi:hypothetical protein
MSNNEWLASYDCTDPNIPSDKCQNKQEEYNKIKTMYIK